MQLTQHAKNCLTCLFLCFFRFFGSILILALILHKFKTKPNFFIIFLSCEQGGIKCHPATSSENNQS